MARHVFVRLTRARRAAVAVAASAVLAAGLSPLLPPTPAAAAAAQETVVPATLRSTYPWAVLHSSGTGTGHDGAGSEGVFHRMEGAAGLLWTRYADGTSRSVPTKEGATLTYATGADVLAHRYADGRVELWDASGDTTETVRVPEGQNLITAYDGVVVTSSSATAGDGTTVKTVHLLTPESGGTTRDVAVDDLPAGLRIGAPRGADATGLFFYGQYEGKSVVVGVDRESGSVSGWTQPLAQTYRGTVVTPGHVVLYTPGDAEVLVLPRSDLSATPTGVTLESDGLDPARYLAVIGDWLVYESGFGKLVKAQPIAGGAAVTLLPESDARGISVASDGTATVVGRTAAATDDWGIQRIHPDQDGDPVVTQVKALPKPPAEIRGIALEQGRLIVADESRAGARDTYVRTVAATGTPEFGARSSHDGSALVLDACPAQDGGCAVHGTADNRAVWLAKDSSGFDRLRADGPGPHSLWERPVPAGGRITDVSGRYVIHTTATQQTVFRIGDFGAPTATRAPGAAALSGDVLWTAGGTPGTVTSLNLTTRATAGLATDAGCTPSELQALGRYLYWACDGKAGVYDRTARKSVPVPAGEAKLGDGYVVTHDEQAGTLVLTAVADGTPVSRVIGELPDTGVSQRDVRWTVDEAGANAAYVDDQERVHLVPSGVAQQPLRLLGPVQQAPHVEAHEFDAVPDTLATLLLSKPASGWSLSVRNRATGEVHAGGRGVQEARGELTVDWSGDDPTATGDVFLPNGFYDWTVTVTPADGTGAPLEARGTVRLLHGDPVRHDHVGAQGMPDGTGDLLTLNSAGALTFQQGTGKGTFSGKVSGSGWSTSVVAVPFGDLNGDRCNDVLVRMSDGSLRGYKVKCGLAPSASMSYTKLGTGWNAYNVLTSPGDLTGDKRADLLARKASSGDVHLFAAKSDGTLAAGRKIRSAWTGYTKVVGAGDLNGDGHGDVLAHDRSGTLWLYKGAGSGLLKDRVKVFAGWGAGYDVIVGTGDITGDGRSDLVSRDGSGDLWRNNGDGKGSFGSRVRIASGWQGYRGIF